jgi:hypothetical protein
MITHKRAKQVLHYDPITGHLTWKVKPKYRPTNVGDRAGAVGWKGYRFVKVDGVKYSEHRLIIFWMTGKWPPEQTDHHDEDKASNKWVNIRPADGSQNQANRSLTKRNTTGYKGVTGRQFAGAYKYIAQISHRGVNTHLGVFATAELAHAAYCEAAQRLHKEFFNAG